MGNNFACPCTTRKSEEEKLLKYQSRNVSPTKRILTDEEMQKVNALLKQSEDSNFQQYQQLRKNEPSLKGRKIRLTAGEENNLDNLLTEDILQEIRSKTTKKPQKKHLQHNLSLIEEEFLKILFFHPKEQFLYSFKGKMHPTSIIPNFENHSAKIVVYQAESAVTHLSFNITTNQNYNEISYDTNIYG